MNIRQYIVCNAGKLWKAITPHYAKKIVPEEVCQHCWYECEYRKEKGSR